MIKESWGQKGQISLPRSFISFRGNPNCVEKQRRWNRKRGSKGRNGKRTNEENKNS